MSKLSDVKKLGHALTNGIVSLKTKLEKEIELRAEVRHSP